MSSNSFDFDDDFDRNPRSGGDHDSDSNWIISYADLMTLLVGFFVMLQSFSSLDSKKFEQTKRETAKRFGGEYKLPLEELQQDLQNLIKEMHLDSQVLLESADDGIVITFRGALFFDSGSVAMRPEAEKLLTEIGPQIKDKAAQYRLIIEGHTDDVPVSNGIVASNWELSSLRACAVLRFFETLGFGKERLQAIGWGETRPVKEFKEPPSSEDRATNRRVVIKITR